MNENGANVYDPSLESSVKSTSPSLSELSHIAGTAKPEPKTLPTSPFVFPEIYKPEAGVIDLSSCISTEENSLNHIPYAVKTGTPDSTTVIKKLQIGTQPLSTPVVNMPTVLTRQTSFRDR